MNRRETVTLLCLSFGACAHSQTALRPAAQAHFAPFSNLAAQTNEHGVEIVAEAPGWPAGAAPTSPVIGDALTPFKVKVRNDSSTPLQVRLDSFVLTAADGTHYRAIPVFPGRDAAMGPRAIEQPGFTFRGFAVAPYLASAYPSVPRYHGQFDFEALYYDRLYDPSTTAALPLADLRSALPEGVLAPGGWIEGYLYFQSPTSADLSKGNLRFQARLAQHATTEPIARLSIPFAATNR